MSEPTANELVRRVGFTIRRANVVETPIDPTLRIQGEAADAKATGDAIAAVMNGATVNGKTFTDKAVVVYAGDIKMSSMEGASSISEAMTELGNKEASDIMYDSINLVSIKDAIDDIVSTIDGELSNDDIDDIFDEVFGGVS